MRTPNVHLPTPDRSQVKVIDDDIPAGLTDEDVIAAFRQGYDHMLANQWFAAVAAYNEAVRLQPEVAGLYNARGTAHLYGRDHDDATADYSKAIELEPDNPSHWRRRAHAHSVRPIPEPERSIEDATKAIELAPDHHMGYGHRAMAEIQLPTPDWESALSDVNRFIELYPGHDAEAYKLRALIHDNLGNHEEAGRDRRSAE